MIKNEKQYKTTKSRKQEFLKSLDVINLSADNVLLKDLMSKSLKSQIETFDREILEYEKLKSSKPRIILTDICHLPEALIKARIARGLSHSDLAKATGLKEQQIQRYESNNYESANFDRIITIAKCMKVRFDDTKLILEQDELRLEGYDQTFIREATNRLQSRKALLTV